MIDDEGFAEATGLVGPEASRLMFENRDGVASIDFDTFKQQVMALADVVRSGGDYLAPLHMMDPAIRPRVVEAALRAVLHDELLADEDPLGVARLHRRMHEVIISYRRLTASDDSSWSGRGS